MGRFQLEAAVQSVHCNRLLGGKTDGYGVMQLYRGLLQIRPTVAAALGRAEEVGAEQGLLCLEQIDEKVPTDFEPGFATRAALLVNCSASVMYYWPTTGYRLVQIANPKALP